MNNKIYPCLWFNGTAKQAAELYCSVFSNSKITTNTPSVVLFEIDRKKVMGLNGGAQFKLNPSVSFFITCHTVNEIETKWNKLLDGGKVLMPLNVYPWSEKYGWLQDKYGVSWQMMLGNEQNKPGRILPSFLFTQAQFGKAEAAINRYTEIFPGSKKIVSIPYPPADANAGKTTYAEFNLNGSDFIAMDGPGEHNFSFNEAFSFVIDCNDQHEVDYYWNSLIKNGGEESMCAWIKDEFGVWWQIVPKRLVELLNDTNQQRASKVMQAMLKMKKIIVADLEKAYNS